jgi:hypothetical protein
MKSLMRNTLFSALLAAPALVASAQQNTLPALAPIAVTGNVQLITPVRIAGTSNADGYYYYSEKQVADSNLKSKEVSKEISTPKGGDIYIENSSGSIVVKTWSEQKVKVTTTVYYTGEPKFTDEEWLERANLSLKTLGNSVKIKSGGGYNGSISYTTSSYTIISGNATYSVDRGQNGNSRSRIKRIVTITVPAGSKIDVESKYGDLQLPAGIGDAYVDITNGNLEAENLNKLNLRSRYSNANVGDVKTAELEFSNGRFSAKNIDDLDVESKYSTIEMAAAKKLSLRSTNDEYEIEEAGEIHGRKNYGNLRITKLNNSIDLEGANADVKIRNAGPSLSLIKINNRYADVRIPLREVKNYTVDFAGNYSSVYGNFEKVPVAATEKEKTVEDKVVIEGVEQKASTAATAPRAATINGGGDVVYVTGRLAPTRSTSWGNDSSNPPRFTAKVGSGAGLKIDLKCQNCTVDFK